MTRFGLVLVGVIGVSAAVAAGGEQARTSRQGSPPQLTAGGQSNWSSHNVDLNNSRYSPLDEINTSTVGRLGRQWTFQADPTDSITQVTPLVVDGVMYLHAPAKLLEIRVTVAEELRHLLERHGLRVLRRRPVNEADTAQKQRRGKSQSPHRSVPPHRSTRVATDESANRRHDCSMPPAPEVQILNPMASPVSPGRPGARRAGARPSGIAE